jgi:hypothetical protein
MRGHGPLLGGDPVMVFDQFTGQSEFKPAAKPAETQTATPATTPCNARNAASGTFKRTLIVRRLRAQ